MKIEHIAIWTNKLEEMKEFYEKFLNGKSNEKYINEKKHFEAYFITFESGARIELMRNTTIKDKDLTQILSGYTHVAFSLGSKEEVDRLTNLAKENGYQVTSEPRTTGDGYYESCFLDPDNNIIELTI